MLRQLTSLSPQQVQGIVDKINAGNFPETVKKRLIALITANGVKGDPTLKAILALEPVRRLLVLETSARIYVRQKQLLDGAQIALTALDDQEWDILIEEAQNEQS